MEVGEEEITDNPDEDEEMIENNDTDEGHESLCSSVTINKRSPALFLEGEWAERLTVDNNCYKQAALQCLREPMEEGIVPVEEKDCDLDQMHLKQVNNSNFTPSMHSRYINDDSHVNI